MAGLASEADFIFIPESPAVVDWPVVICDKILQVHCRRWVYAKGLGFFFFQFSFFFLFYFKSFFVVAVDRKKGFFTIWCI